MVWVFRGSVSRIANIHYPRVFSSMLRLTFTLLVPALCLPLAAQVGAEMNPAKARASNAWIVRFSQRSFDLEGFRTAVRRKVTAPALAALVRDLEAAVRRDQRAFSEQLRRAGGAIDQQWWIVNGCSIRATRELAAQLRRWPNVAAVEPDQRRRAHLDVATNLQHHSSDLANTLRSRTGELVRGTGIVMAMLDSGADASAGATGRPHRSFYLGGDVNNRSGGGIAGSLLRDALHIPNFANGEDASGHGTGVIGSAMANRWTNAPGADDGIAPNAGVLSVRIADAQDVTTDSWMITGWQIAAARRIQDNVAVGNCSFGGSPDLNNSLQIAMDNVARAADMLICVSAGNDGNNTSESQHAYNGLAIGSVDKGTLRRSSYSAIGPLRGTNRTYPDLCAVGNQLHTVRPDDEVGTALRTGTSLASPLVAGIAALVRQADKTLTALETKAILLNSATTKGPRNEYGVGFLRADDAVVAAVARDVSTALLLGNHHVARFPIRPSAGPTAVTVTWMRNPAGIVPEIDVRILDSQNLEVGRDGNSENSYEQVRFVALQASEYTVEVTWKNPSTPNDELEFAIAGAKNSERPSLSAALPAATPAYEPGLIELQGHGLAPATAVRVRGTSVPFEILDESIIRFYPPAGQPIGLAPVQVITRFGLSNAIQLHLTAPPTPLLLGDGAVLRGTTHDYRILADRDWTSLLTVSLSDQPSSLPGFFKLGIGNDFRDLLILRYLPLNTSGEASLRWTIPASAPTNTTFYFQALTADLSAPILPYPVTNVLQVRVY